jgi:hypothetical protein
MRHAEVTWAQQNKGKKAKKAKEDVYKSVDLHSDICTLKRHDCKTLYVGQT